MQLDDLIFTHWGWFILTLFLGALEIAAPGAFMIWLAGAALVTGLMTLVYGFGWELQLAAFGVLAIASVLAGRFYFRERPMRSADPSLNRRADRLIGEVVTVAEAISGGQGRVQVGDSPWLAAGPDMPAGARARIVRVDGSRLHVEPA
jgi:inner membrane protein